MTIWEESNMSKEGRTGAQALRLGRCAETHSQKPLRGTDPRSSCPAQVMQEKESNTGCDYPRIGESIAISRKED
jgi:hypothetical protein